MFGIVAPVAGTEDKDMNNVLVIFKVLSNDNIYKQRVEELKALAAQANDVQKAAEAASAEAESKQKEAAQTLAEIERVKQDVLYIKNATEASEAKINGELTEQANKLISDKNEFDKVIKQARVALASLQAQQDIAFAAREKELADKISDAEVTFAAKTKALEEESLNLDQRDRELQAAEKANKEKSTALRNQEADLQDRVAKIKTLVG